VAKHLGFAGVALTAALATACGSTVQSATTTSTTGLSGDLGGNRTATQSTGGTSPTTTPSGTTQSDSGLAAQIAAASAPPGSTNTGPASAASSQTTGTSLTGRGYDAKHVYIGFPTQTDASSAAKGLGIAGLNFGDQVGEIRAAIALVNRRGGILGRQAVPVFHDIKTASLETDPETAAQAACTAFTQDTLVAAVVNLVAGIDRDTFYACLKNRGVPAATGGYIAFDDTTMRAFSPYVYHIGVASYDAVIPTWLTRLKALGYFSGWDTTAGGPGAAPVKIGLLYAQQQPQARIAAKLKAAFVQRGYTIAAEFAYDASTFDTTTRGMAAAVLPFRSAGVTHVFTLDSAVLAFMLAAENQHYRPRYALNTYHGPGAALQGNVAAQLVGSMGIGWAPTSDVDSGHDPGSVGPAAAACEKAMRDAGVDVSSRSALWVAMMFCDGVSLLAAAANAGGGFTAAAAQTGVSRLTGRFPSATVFNPSGLTGTRLFLASRTRDFAWSTACSCFVYGQGTSQL
jgi:hypothetical protein